MKTESTIDFISMGPSIFVLNNMQVSNIFVRVNINMGSNENICFFKHIDYFFAKT